MKIHTIIYPGYGQPPKFGKAIPDSPEARALAIAEGATAFTTTSFEYESEKGKPEPTRYGSLFLGLDCKESPEKAVLELRQLVDVLAGYYRVPPEMLRFWMSGGKGCHMEIPAKLFGGEAGHQRLPHIHRVMVEAIILEQMGKLILTTWDRSLYAMGKGKLLCVENIKFDNGCYKVPVTYAELSRLSYTELEFLTHSPRYLTEAERGEAPMLTPLEGLYSRCVQEQIKKDALLYPSLRLEDIESCAFLTHCRENAATLPEPQWFAMISNLAHLGPKGFQLIHEYSNGHPDYSREKTDEKIQHALTLQQPYSCHMIKELFDCGKDCRVRDPLHRFQTKEHPKGAQERLAEFKLLTEGLFYAQDGAIWKAEKVSSPIEVTAKCRTPEGFGWGRFCRLSAPDGQQRELYFSMAELTSTPDALLGRLMNSGLELMPGTHNKKRLLEYLQLSEPGVIIYQTDKLGWHGNVFVLNDKAYGTGQIEEYRYSGQSGVSPFEIAGTCEDWKREIGNYCRKNPLLTLLCSYAFTGPLLRPCGMEGGGVHLYGSSSVGKTTAIRVAGSICGGGGQHGFLLTWRTTSNGLEGVAVQHNDNLLCLDEIGEAGANVVSDTAYMLANGQGKGRANRRGEQQPRKSWVLSFLSTGELTLDDKIQLDSNRSAMAGQLVRILDIAADAGQDMGVFSHLHEFSSGAELSRHLNEQARLIYGGPLRIFLERLISDLQASVTKIREFMVEFRKQTLPEDCAPQVERVCGRFALIAAAGELATEFGILPLDQGEARQAANLYFQSWLVHRGGVGEMEVEKSFARLKDFIDMYGENRFINIDADMERPWPVNNIAGYRWRQSDGKWVYLILNLVAKEAILRTCAPIKFRTFLEQRGYWPRTRADTYMDTKSISGQGNKRGLFVIPENWTEDVQSSEQETASHKKTHAQSEPSSEDGSVDRLPGDDGQDTGDIFS